ncbi:isochorismatase family protein [Syntrophorhabdus aromaticivorans]|uniref:isochorismatase family protein n=1 Tax=Syntrophorhabdus aromaticivorans TaxID=328301 RepID=UPI0003FECAEC|nr:isochorismatase family protein [Syntrophorhabdus aromaticivorans]
MRRSILFSRAILLGVFLYAFPVFTVIAQEKIGVIVVDVQGDFTTWKKGALAVPGTDQAFIRKLESATALLARNGFTIYATQDWHPADHISFAVNHPGKVPFDIIEIGSRTQTLWPPHCVQGTERAKVLLDNNMFLAIAKKGQNTQFDGYSGFQDDGGARTEMHAILGAAGIRKLIIYGIATDHSVKATAIDAVIRGYKVTVIEGLSKGITPEATAKALQEMRAKGVLLLKEIDMTRIAAM